MMSIKMHQDFVKPFYVSIIFLLSVFVVSCGESTDGVSVSNTSNSPAASVGLSVNTIDIQPGSTTKVDIIMSDFPVSEGGGVTVKYDPNLLQVINVTVNKDTWDFVNQSGSVDNEKGVVTNILVSSYKGVSGNEVIATLEIEANNAGSGDILIEESAVNPFASGGNKVAVKFLKSEVNVQAVN